MALVELRTAAGTQAFRCDAGERLLYAGLAAGANMSYGCATGTCGDCRATLLEGMVQPVWPQAPGRRALKKPEEILLCQSTPLGDCVVQARGASCTHPRALPRLREGVISSVDCDADGLAWVVVALERPMRFLAGQFVLLSIPGVEGFRAYSPAHDGADVKELALVVRAKAGGGLSPLLCSTRAVGERVAVLGPLGTAHVHPDEDEDMAILVGGSGAGVALSLVDWAVGSGHLLQHRVDVVCGLRTPRSTQVIDRLAAAAAKYPGRLRVVLALSDADADVPLAGLQVEHGMAHEVAARVLAPEEWKKRAVFVAGPAPMVEASLRMLLVHARLSPTKIRYDSFS